MYEEIEGPSLTIELSKNEYAKPLNSRGGKNLIDDDGTLRFSDGAYLLTGKNDRMKNGESQPAEESYRNILCIKHIL